MDSVDREFNNLMRDPRIAEEAELDEKMDETKTLLKHLVEKGVLDSQMTVEGAIAFIDDFKKHSH